MELTNEFRDSPPHWAARIRRQFLLYCFKGKKVNSFHYISLGEKSTLQVRCSVTLAHHAEITLFPYMSFALIFAFLCAEPSHAGDLTQSNPATNATC